MVVVGAGLIGLKAAEGLAPVVGSVHVVELAPRVLPMILDDAGGCARTAAHGGKRRDAFHLGITVVEKVVGDKARRKSDPQGTAPRLTCDVSSSWAWGVRPNVAQAKAAGVEVHRGIVIDTRSRTNVKDIWAAGDVTESCDLISGECRIMALWPNAYAQGRAAGCDMCGKCEDFEGVFPMNAVGFFGLPIITAGLQGGEDTQVLVKDDPKKGTMKRFIVKDDLLVGMILVGDVDRAGIYTSLMSEKIPLSTLEKGLTDDGFGLMALGFDRMKQRISKSVRR